MDSNEVELIILTRSSKHRNKEHENYCITGIDVKNHKFVRLNSEDVQIHGAISPDDCKYENGEMCSVLDEVRVQIKRVAPLPTQPENVIIDNEYYWEKISTYTIKDIIKYCQNDVSSNIFGDNRYCISESVALAANCSLVLVMVTDVVIYREQNSYGTLKSKIDFIYNGKKHECYSLTDPDFYKVPDGTVCQEALLVVSLPDSEKYYKFVAKIFDCMRYPIIATNDKLPGIDMAFKKGESTFEKENIDSIIVDSITQYEKGIVKIILACVAELDFSVGINKLVGILRGSQSSFVRENGLNHKQTYSLLCNLSKGQLQYIINLLISCGLLQLINVSRFNISMPVIQITDSGEKYLIDIVQFEVSFIDFLAGEEILELDDFQLRLFDELRIERKKKANEAGIPAFYVCTDKILVKLAVEMPRTEEQLLGIKGIGTAFIKKYSESFLLVLRNASGYRDTKSDDVGNKSCKNSESVNSDTVPEFIDHQNETNILNEQQSHLDPVSDDNKDNSYENTSLSLATFLRSISPCLQKNISNNAHNINLKLVEQGYLSEEIVKGVNCKMPTALGRASGIQNEFRKDLNRNYWVNLYDKKAQEMILARFISRG